MYDQASYEQGTPVAHKNILAGGTYTTRKVIIAEGAVLEAGAVLGAVGGDKEAVGAAGVPAPAAATITAAPDAGPGTKVGVHIFRCIVGGSGSAAKWEHRDPDGVLVGVATSTVAYAGGGLSGITIADPGTDPAAGDAFTVTVTEDEDTREWKLSAAAATDGSQVPDVVLAHPCDASDGAKEAIAYETAQLVGSALTLGAGHTIDSIREGLRAKGLLIDS